MSVRLLILLSIVCATALTCTAQQMQVKVAVLDFGSLETGIRAAEQLTRALSKEAGLRVADRDESRLAARGIGYQGSLNLTLEEARDLGSAIGCDFYLTGDAQTLRRNSSARPVFYEAYASLFLVSARTGRLIMWERPSFEAAAPDIAQKMLLSDLGERGARYAAAIRAAAASERGEREFSTTHLAPVIEEVPEESSPQARGLRLPQPYRRTRPIYPETAARAEVEATVDVLVDLDVEGEVTRVEVVRWAGFGLDDSTVNTIRQMHFRPAMRDGVPLPMRVLLRYNFQRPAKEVKR
jgi:TonB family protein